MASPTRSRVAPRRTHKKSRTGCSQCKERRVKCDEARPQCTNCTYRQLRCSYLENAERPFSGDTTYVRSPVDATHHRDGHGYYENPHKVDTIHYSLQDLQLMHYFSTETYKSLCADQSDMPAWQSVIPQHAYTHEFLMRGILAVTALHMSATTTDPKLAISYLNTALRYNSLSVGPFREALDNLTPQNCDAVYAYSAIITLIGIASPSLNARHRKEPLKMVENMVTFFELIQGATKISRIGAQWLQSGIFSKYSFWHMPTAEIDEETTQALDRLFQLNRHCNGSNPEQQATTCIHRTIDLLKACFAKYAHTPNPVPILAWMSYVDKDFVDGLRLHNAIYLLVFMHWGVLLDKLDPQFWWAEGSGKALLTEISTELITIEDTGDALWREALEWPQRKVGSLTMIDSSCVN